MKGLLLQYLLLIRLRGGNCDIYIVCVTELSRRISRTFLDAPTGAELWSFTTGGVIQSSPAVADGVLYIGSEDNHVYALNATTGLPLWSFTAGFVVDFPPAVVNGVLYIGSLDGNVYAFH